jgi:hypothetical protein
MSGAAENVSQPFDFESARTGPGHDLISGAKVEQLRVVFLKQRCQQCRYAWSYSTTARSMASAQATNKLTADERRRRSDRTRQLGRQCLVRQCDDGVKTPPQPAHSV